MKNAIVKTLTIGAAAIIVATATGCTDKNTLSRIDAAEASAKAAAQEAAAARSAADSAAAAAASAANAASSAQSTANQALQSAQGAQACCDATNEKIDRAFNRAMGK
jgi:Alanine-zipper, major outer membrane lipoprotein